MLTPKRARFAQEFLIDLCATRAARRAGYSASTANVQASRLMKNPEVRAAIRANMDARAQRLNVKADTVLSEIAEVALHRMTVGLGRRFAPHIRMQSKQKALDQLKRHLGPYGDKVLAACFEHFAERLKTAGTATRDVVDRDGRAKTAPLLQASYCDWLPPDDQSSPNVPPLLPSAPLSSGGFAATEYDPNT